MVRCIPMGYIRRSSDSSSRGTLDTKFIRCIDCREFQMHKLWCLGLDNITRKVHPTAQVKVGAGTVGYFNTNYLAENGRIIPIIGQISINGNVQFLGIPNFSGEVDCRLLKKCKTPLCPLAGETVIIPIKNGKLAWGDLTEVSQSLGVVPSLPVCITCLEVWLNHALLRAASVMIYFFIGVASV